MKRISRDCLCYRFDKDLAPVIEIDPGEEIIIETQDAHNGTVPRGSLGEDVLFPELSEENGNPVTGPIFVHNALPGDTLSVLIKDIRLDKQGFVPIRPNWGVITGKVERPYARVIVIQNKIFLFNDKIHLPVRPMVGTIGIAPTGKGVAAMYPGSHGGNMDNNYVCQGSTVFLPVSVEGALLALGDIHASMGDGEITSGGIDISAEVTAKVEIVKGQLLPRPYIETGDSIITCSNAPSFEKARELAVKDMMAILTKKMGLTEPEVLMLISTQGDLGICQACGYPLDITMRVVFPKLWEEKN